MTGRRLGRLSRINVREVWLSEASDFTPWLAREENLAVLAETLGIDLELEAQEKAVGPFRADLLCKDTGTDAWVLVENQLERTDHAHLGQLLTYASGLEAVSIVWIASRFTEEHRSTLDWLNKITDEKFRFFGLEVELWRIGDSPAAPKFNIVSKPNDWSRSVAQAARAMDDTELSDVRTLQRDYWAALNAVLDESAGPISGDRKPLAQSWMAFPVGRSGMHLSTVMIRPKKRIRVELYLTTEKAQAFFRLLHEQRAEVEAELGYPLEWEENPDRRDRRIAAYLDETDPEDRDDWPRQHRWMAKTLNDFRRAFSSRVRALNPDDLRQGSETSASGDATRSSA